MPIGNNFQHATYARSDPGNRVAYREFAPGAPADSLAWQDAMARLGADLSAGGVRAIVFLHGTFLSTDLFGAQRLDEAGGLKRGYSRGIPGMEALLALMRQDGNGLPAMTDNRRPPYTDDEATRRLIDEQAGEAGNFTGAYLDLFAKGVNRDLARPISCARHLWSSEHHHLGRADAAWRLLDRLNGLCRDLRLTTGDRVLVQAHGQAGLLLALASNLLAPPESSGRKSLLGVLEAYHRATNADAGKIERLHGIAARLATGTMLGGAALDVVTLGTPVRYGWDPSGLGKLLHIVNHRPMRTDGKRWLAKMELPQITMEMPLAWGGDYVQQLAVAGSDAVPAMPEAQAANKALWELLEPYDGFERWLECARKSVRCQNDGQCLLVDYKDTVSQDPREHVYGHAAYTRLNAMLFNTTDIVRTLYRGCAILS
jgi:hypothetical protein